MTTNQLTLKSRIFRLADMIIRHRLIRYLTILIVGGLGGLLALSIWHGESLSTDIALIHGRLAPARYGSTTIELPPFGAISAHTHNTPLHFTLRLDELRVDRLLTLITDDTPRAKLTRQLKYEMQRFIKQLIFHALIIAALGGLLLCRICGMRRYALLGGMLSGVLVISLPLLVTWRSYHPQAFENPSYHGELTRAPQLLMTAQDIWRNYNNWENRVPILVNRVVLFYHQMDRVSSITPAEETKLLRVLQISDLHNNPLGMKLAISLAEEYKVDLVLVTGDITDFGHPLEADLLQRWDQFTMPVAVISGNHDSQTIMRRLAEFPRVTVLPDGKIVTLAGLRLMGYGDPAAARIGMGDVNSTRPQLNALTKRIRQRFAEKPQVDIFMVHNFRVAEKLFGITPVILTGHSHQAKFLQRNYKVLINPGSTGAAGLRYFSGKFGTSYGATVLSFSPVTHRLILVDYIALDEPTGNYTITRHNLSDVTTPQRQGELASPSDNSAY